MDPVHGGERKPLTERAQLFQICWKIQTAVTGQILTKWNKKMGIICGTIYQGKIYFNVLLIPSEHISACTSVIKITNCLG